jgi:hypothetical protein
MADLAEIEALLNIEIGDKRLKNGKKYKNKNQYYYYEQNYYIVKLSQNKWMICEDCRTTRKLLRKHCWYTGTYGYGETTVVRNTKMWHKLFLNYENGLVADHINNRRYDNRFDNLRVVTYTVQSRNKSKPSNNTSGKQGVSLWVDKRDGYQYWTARIRDDTRRVKSKRFSVRRLGEVEAKRQAIECREQWEEAYGYLGD